MSRLLLSVAVGDREAFSLNFFMKSRATLTHHLLPPTPFSDNAHARSVETRGREAASGEGVRASAGGNQVSHGDPHAAAGSGEPVRVAPFRTASTFWGAKTTWN